MVYLLPQISHRRKAAIWLFLLAFCFAPTVFSNEEALKEKQLQKLKDTIEALQKQLESTKSRRNAINKNLETTEKNIGELNKKARDIRQKLEDSQSKLDTLRKERKTLSHKKHTQENLVGDYINAAYRLGQQGNLRMLLNQEDPGRVARNLKYYNYFATARAEKITAYVATIDRINAIEPEIAFYTEKVRSDYRALNNKKAQLVDAQSERKIILAKLNSKISSQDQRLQALTEDRRQLEKLLRQMVETIADVQLKSNVASFASLKGELPWPTQGKVLRSFGSQRVANKMKWEGLLIASPAGDPVKAIHYGRVIFSDYLRGHGLLIIIDHGTGFMSLYAHNEALYKELGEWVDSSETIAAVGDSGGQQRAALYFELRYKGKPTNPRAWFRRT